MNLSRRGTQLLAKMRHELEAALCSGQKKKNESSDQNAPPASQKKIKGQEAQQAQNKTKAERKEHSSGGAARPDAYNTGAADYYPLQATSKGGGKYGYGTKAKGWEMHAWGAKGWDNGGSWGKSGRAKGWDSSWENTKYQQASQYHDWRYGKRGNASAYPNYGSSSYGYGASTCSSSAASAYSTSPGAAASMYPGRQHLAQQQLLFQQQQQDVALLQQQQQKQLFLQEQTAVPAPIGAAATRGLSSNGRNSVPDYFATAPPHKREGGVGSAEANGASDRDQLATHLLRER